jgi:hypothetical protein
MLRVKVRGSSEPPGRRFAFLALGKDSLENFFSVNLYFGRGVNPDPDLIPLNSKNRDRDVFPDDELFPDSSCQYEHEYLPLASDHSVPK